MRVPNVKKARLPRKTKKAIRKIRRIQSWADGEITGNAYCFTAIIYVKFTTKEGVRHTRRTEAIIARLAYEEKKRFMGIGKTIMRHTHDNNWF